MSDTMTDVEALAAALADVEDAKINAHPECMTDECDHDECPDWGAIGCGDADVLLAALTALGYSIGKTPVAMQGAADKLGEAMG